VEFADFARRCLTQKGGPEFEGLLLSLDPGHTTGWAVFENYKLVACGQIIAAGIDHELFQAFNSLFTQYNPVHIVFEDYRIYAWRKSQHVGSELLTTQVIGAIQTIASMDPTRIIPISKQPASVAKNFCTDAKLQEWGFWPKGQKHARDAIRHGCYFLLFGGREKWLKQQRTISKTKKTVG